MQTNGSNILKGKVVKVIEGAVDREITLEITPGVEIVGTITKTSAALLGLSEGKIAFAVIKASDVMFGVD